MQAFDIDGPAFNVRGRLAIGTGHGQETYNE